MDYQNGPQGTGGGADPKWGRLDPLVGAYVDDNSRALFGAGVGWVTADDRVRWRGRDFAITDVPAELQPKAQDLAAKAKRLFAGAQPPVADQMRDVQARAAAPPPQPIPATPPHPSHKLVADSFRHLANVLTKANAAPGGA